MNRARPEGFRHTLSTGQYTDSRLRELEKCLKGLGMPDEGSCYLRISRHSGKPTSVSLIYPTRKVPPKEFAGNDVLDAVGAPEFGLVTLKVGISKGRIANLKVLGEERTVDLKALDSRKDNHSGSEEQIPTR